jgi:hypothetical protein
MDYANAMIVKELYQATLLTQDEARSLLRINQPDQGLTTLGSGNENMMPGLADKKVREPTRGEEIAAASIAIAGDGIRFSTPGDPQKFPRYLTPPLGETESFNALPHIRRCIADLIDKAIAEERESCAKVADGLEAGQGIDRNQSPYRAYRADVAAMIRQRGVA